MQKTNDMQNLLISLNERIDRIHTDNWGKRGAPVLRLDKGVRLMSDNTLSGAIEVLVPTVRGELVHYSSHSLAGINSLEKLDDLLAEILSKALAEHMNWPR